MKTAEPTVMETQSALEMLAKNNEGVKGNKQPSAHSDGKPKHHYNDRTRSSSKSQDYQRNNRNSKRDDARQHAHHRRSPRHSNSRSRGHRQSRSEPNPRNMDGKKDRELHMEFTRVMEQPKPMDMDKPLAWRIVSCLKSSRTPLTTTEQQS